MRRVVIALLGGLGGYVIGAFVGYVLVNTMSANAHDGSVEAAMTGAFVFGPLGGVVGLIIGVVAGRRRGGTP